MLYSYERGMADIKMQWSGAGRGSDNLNSCERTISGIADRVSRIQNSSVFSSGEMIRYRRIIQNAAKEIQNECTSLRSLQSGLEQIIRLYQGTEQKISGKKQPTRQRKNSGGNGSGGSGKLDVKWAKDLLGLIFTVSNADREGLLKKIWGKGLKTIAGTAKDMLSFNIKKKTDKLNDKINDKLKSKGVREESNDKSYYKNGKKLDKAEYLDEKDNDKIFYEKEASILQGGLNGKLEEKLFEKKWNLGKWGEAGVDIGKAEMHADLNAGLYIMNKNGERKFCPGIDAEIGASATAFEANWEDQLLGNEMLGAYANATATAGKVGVTAGVAAQLFRQGGKFSPQLGAGVSAEAIAGELRGSVGGNVLGGKVGVTGAVNYGLGAHADVGFKDGVFKFDIGATIGVGASVGAEIDFGGMVDTICDTASSGWDGLKELGDNIVDGAEDVADGIVDGAKGIAKGVSNAIDDVGEAWDGFKGLFD